MFGDIVLVLADADRLGFDFHEFGERVLQAPGDRDRPAQGDIELRQFGRRIGRRRIDRRAGLRHDDLGRLDLRMLFQKIGDEPICLARRRAIADGDEIDIVARAQCGERGKALVPAPLRFVRIDGGCGHHLAGRVHHRHLHAGAKAGIEPHGRARAGRSGQQEVAQIGAEHAHRLVFRMRPQTQPEIDGQLHFDLGAPRPTHAINEPFVAGPPAIGHADASGNGEFIWARNARDWIGGGVRHHAQVENLLALAAHDRENAVRGQFGQRLGKIEIIGKFRAGLFLAFAYFRGENPALPEILAQPADQFGVFGETLDQNGARAFQRCLRRLDGFRLQIRGTLFLRLAFGMGEQRFGQRLQPVLARDLRLGAALGLVWQIDVFQSRFRVGGVDLPLQRGVEFALGLHTLEDRRAPLFQLAQVTQPLFQRAQLRVVERASRLLAVARDEGNGRAAVQQVDGGPDLGDGDVQFFGDALVDRLHSDRLNKPREPLW